MKHKKLTALLAVLAVSALGVGALSYYSGTAEKKQNDFNIVAGQKDQDGAGTIQEPAQENGGKADAAAGLQPDQIVPKDPYIVSNVDWTAWAIMKVEVPKFTEEPNVGKPAAELLNVNADGKQKLLRELDDAEKHTVVYGYTEPLAGNNSTKPEAERAKTSSLFDSFKITGDISLANTYTGVIRVSGTLLQTEGHTTVDDAAEGSGITPKSYAITYNLGENAVLSGQKTRYTADDYGYTPPTPTRDGYDFVGQDPASIPADSTGNVTITAKQKKAEQTATLLDGPTLNIRMRTLAGDDSPTTDNYNESITAIQMSDTEPSADIKASAASLVSTENSKVPIYMWFENGTIKLWSESEKIQASEDLSYLCNNMTELTNIDGLKNIDTSNTTNMESIFHTCNIANTSSLEKQNTDNVTNMNNTFAHCSYLKDIKGLANQNTKNVSTMDSMFFSDGIQDLTPLANWNTSNVTSMYRVFASTQIDDLTPLASQDTSNVTYMPLMFSWCTKLTTLTGLETQNTSNVTNMFSMFSLCQNIKDASAINDQDITNVKPGENNSQTEQATGFFMMFDAKCGTHPEFTKRAGTWSGGTFVPSD